MDDEKKDFDENQNVPIDGQLGLEDLYYEMSTKEQVDESITNNPIDGQISLDDICAVHSNQDTKNMDSTMGREDNEASQNAINIQTFADESNESGDSQEITDSNIDENIIENAEEQNIDESASQDAEADDESLMLDESSLAADSQETNTDGEPYDENLEDAQVTNDEPLETENANVNDYEDSLDDESYDEPQEDNQDVETAEEAGSSYALVDESSQDDYQDKDIDTNKENIDADDVETELENEFEEVEDTQENTQDNLEENEPDDHQPEKVPTGAMVGDVELSSLGNIFKDDFVEPENESETAKTEETKNDEPDDNGDYKAKIEDILNKNLEQVEEQKLAKMKKEKGVKPMEDFFEDKIEDFGQEQNTGVQDTNNSNENADNSNGSGGEGKGLFYKNIDEVLHESMIPYSEHVIMDRALPRVEDGLKPVQRRILYSMLDLGITPDKPYRKSARIVGDCLGKYHPHGDTSVYDAMVRMAQPFNMNEILITGHGNFGSIDGDKAAAMRYTEARLAPLALELLRDLDKDTVKWSLNFDDTIKEPDTLPGRFPNLLVNGAMGIAVGLATNIPPHNLAEVIDGVVAYIDRPSITLKEMMKYIKGPDFPTGGFILPTSEIEQAFATGKGKIIMRAKMHIEGNGTDKRSVVITELPYQVNKSAVLQKIAALRDDDKNTILNGISDIRDESDRNGLRAVIKIKKDANLKAIVEYLLKYTDLQCSFGVNMVAIADGKPKLMGLLDIIKYYVEYQREVVLRRTKFDLERTKERLHILEGLLIAIKNIDEVIKIIKSSPNVSTAKQRLRDRFSLSEKQAQAILDMKLARLTNLEVNNLQEEIKKNKLLVEQLTAIVNSKKAQFEVVKTEILAIKKQYKSDRKSIILKSSDSLELPADDDKEAVVEGYIAVNAVNNIKFINKKAFGASQKEFKETSNLYEIHKILTKTDTDKTAYIFTNKGNCYKVPVKSIPEARFKDKGTPFASVVKCDKGEIPCGIFSIDEDMPKGNLIFMTKQGMVKKTSFKEYGVSKSTFQAIKLKDDDEVINIFVEEKSTTLLFVTRSGMVLNADKSDVPIQGRISGGVKGINLNAGDYVIFAGQVTEDGEVVVMTNRGFIKRVVVSQIDVMARYRKGIKIVTLSEKDNGTELVYASYVKENFVVVGEADDGKLYGRDTDVCPIENRTGKGKLIEKMKKPPVILRGYRYLV